MSQPGEIREESFKDIYIERIESEGYLLDIYVFVYFGFTLRTLEAVNSLSELKPLKVRRLARDPSK